MHMNPATPPESKSERIDNLFMGREPSDLPCTAPMRSIPSCFAARAARQRRLMTQLCQCVRISATGADLDSALFKNSGRSRPCSPSQKAALPAQLIDELFSIKILHSQD
jgi:hypothetical protein